MNENTDELMENHIVRRSNLPWRSNPVIVPNSDGTMRVCVDYRALNQGVSDSYPMQRTDSILDGLGQRKYFSVIDLKSEFYQIPLSAKDAHKTAFCTPRGIFGYTKMPFGLKNAPASFQRVMDKVLFPLSGICTGVS